MKNNCIYFRFVAFVVSVGLAGILGGIRTANAQTAVTVVEYYNSKITSYFLTGRSTEQATLDAQSDFQRTGMSFQATDAATAPATLAPVCRYRIVVNASSGVDSHFYGLKADCDVVASYKFSNFFYEGLDFAVTAPDSAGNCPSTTPVAVYRTLRSGSTISTPNHRYTVSQTSYQDRISQGWSGEGVAFCVASATDATARPQFSASSASQNVCAAPRVGIDPNTGRAYADRQGTTDDEKRWLRSWIDETYLWYREVPNTLNAASYSTALSYFSDLKTPAITTTGSAKDKFHFTYDTPTWNALSSGGSTVDYGVQWAAIASAPPRQWVAAVVTPNTPAANAGLLRGDSIVSIDGTSFATGNASALNAGLFPTVLGESHAFVVVSAGSSTPHSVQLVADNVTEIPVQNVKTLTSASGITVGYLLFTTHNATAEAYLANAVSWLQQQNVSELVLDMRYNGGGYLDIAAELGYMVAGAARTSGKIFERTTTNDKNPFGFTDSDRNTPFYDTAEGFSETSGTPLPTLNLSRVYVLTSAQTCSASESVINGLRGAGVEVVTVGSTTCGKPYAFYPTDNCGTTYFAIQLGGVNNLGQGDYSDGFSANCATNDDYTKALGDPAEGQLAAALQLRLTGVCAPSATASPQLKRATVQDDSTVLHDPRAELRLQRILRHPR